MIRSTDELVTREFSIVRKGYDPAEVRAYLMALAAELDAADAPSGRSDTPALGAASDPDADDPRPDEGPWSDVGATIARIIETAHAEAAALVASAEAVATDIRRELQREADDTRAASDREAAAARSAAESDRAEAAAAVAAARLEVDRLRSDAEAEAASIRRAAAEDAAAEAATLLASTQSDVRRLLAVRAEAAARLRRVQNLVSKVLDEAAAAEGLPGTASPGEPPVPALEGESLGWE